MNKKYILLCFVYLFLFFSVDACVVKQIHKLRLFDIVGEKCDPLEEGFCLGTLIKVPGDYRPIEDCVVGDVVIDVDGEPTPIVAITRKCVDKYIQYFLKNEVLYVGYDQLFCLDGTNTWQKAYDLSPHMVHHAKTTLYALTTQSHTLCVSRCDVSAYNAAALFLGMPSISLGHIVIAHPVIALFGGIAASLAVVAYNAYKCYAKQTDGKDVCITNLPDPVILAERFYYEQKKTALKKVRQELLSIRDDLITMNGLSSNHFTYQFLQRCAHWHDSTVQIISVNQEKCLSDKQKHSLRTTREKDLEFLEKQIEELQLILALHVNQLINNIKRLEDICVKMSSDIDETVECWNNNIHTITDTIAIQSYSSVLLEDFLINNLCSAYNELIMIADYYRACNNECIHRSTTIIRVLEKIIPDILKKRKIIVESKGCIHKDIAEAEKYFASHNIPIVLLKNQVKQGLEQQQRNYEIESLENIEKIVSGGGFSNDPKKNDDDDENIGKECKQVEIYEKNVLHIFRDEIGHFSSDTPANRRTLIQIASDISNFLGKCKYGNEWYAKILDNGKQVWASVRNGFIRNGGINDCPHSFTIEVGLSLRQ